MADANLGSNLINALGAGQFDVNTMVNGLMEAERAPATARLDRQQETTQTKLDAFTDVQSAITGFKSLLGEVNDLQKLQSRTYTTTNSSVFTAKSDTSSGKLATSGNYEIEVTSLAKAHSVYSNTFTNIDDAVGTGTMTIQFGTWNGSSNFTQDTTKTAVNVTIDSSNNTLQGLKDAINTAGANNGVKASIVNDGSGYRLVMTSTNTGASNGMNISVADGDGNNTDTSGLSRFIYNTTAKNVTQSTAGTDSRILVDGLAVTNASNSVSGVIEGVTLDLFSTSVGTKHTMTVAQDTETAKTAISNFVGDYNALMTVFDEYTKYDGVNAGALQSESLVRSILTDIKDGVSEALASMPTGFQNLADIGISKDRYGKMQIDSTKLDTALTNNFDSVARMFTRSGAADDALISWTSATDDTKVGSYDINITQAYVAPAAAKAGSYTGLETGKASGTYIGMEDSYLNNTVVIDSNNEWLELKLDGVQNVGTSNGRIYIDRGTYESAEAVAAELQNKINADSAFVAAGKSLTVTVDRTGSNPKFVMTSNSIGVGSSIDITDEDSSMDSELGIDRSSGTEIAGYDSYLLGTVQIDGDNNRFRMTLDNENQQWIYLTQQTYENAESLASHMQTQINAAFSGNATVTVDRTGTFPKMVITSNQTGSTSGVTITSVDNKTEQELGLSTTGGVSASGADAVAEVSVAGTINGQPALVQDKHYLKSLTGDSKGLLVDVLGTTTGARGQVHYTEGFASKLDGILATVLKNEEALDMRMDNLTDKLDEISEEREELDVRIAKMEVRWRSQFNALNTLMSQMKSTGDFLTNTFKAMQGTD